MSDIRMFRAQTMKMAGGASTPCIRTDLWGDAPLQNQTACGKQTATCRDFVWGSDMPIQRDVMRAASSSMQTVVEAGAWLGESTSATG